VSGKMGSAPNPYKYGSIRERTRNSPRYWLGYGLFWLVSSAVWGIQAFAGPWSDGHAFVGALAIASAVLAVMAIRQSAQLKKQHASDPSQQSS
jgi:hypothetical protein